MAVANPDVDPETRRLGEDERRERYWKRWGPYLPERQWGTVREDYSDRGASWDYFSHDQARSRAYRWGEDGLLGLCDRQCRLAFAPALWNGHDPILKERLYGLTGKQGNHGEDVKELYYYLDATPTGSYLKALYKYPSREFPYRELLDESRRRTFHDPEYEISDTGVFDGAGYFDVLVEYAKASPDDVAIRFTLANRGPARARLWLLPTLWFRNVWSWGREGEGYGARPRIRRAASGSAVRALHAQLGEYVLRAQPAGPSAPEWLFTENESNLERLFGVPNESSYVKDAFHDYVVGGRKDAVNPAGEGSKAAALYAFDLPASGSAVVRLRLASAREAAPLDDARAIAEVDGIIERRRDEADAFYRARGRSAEGAEGQVARQAYAGLLWSRQFYHYDVGAWLEGDPAQVAPPTDRLRGRNAEWRNHYARDVLSVPDKWEYPWFAAWDLAFHMIPYARVDPAFAKEQLVLLLREWYMHPSGQIPAYEFAFSDVNPPVHAWAAWRVYKIAVGLDGKRDGKFLQRVFQKLLLNFTWWVNRKDADGKNIFAGGFLGLDNIGVFNRSEGLPSGGRLEQSDATAWMAFYAVTMLSMALELARTNPAYEDMASKFFEHFVAIADAMNRLGGTGLWDEGDGFYYDVLHVGGTGIPLKVRSMVGLLPLIAVEVLEDEVIERLPAFRRRMQWFLDNRRDLARQVSFGTHDHGHVLLAVPSRERLERLLRTMLDESEFLSPHGLRSLSRVHAEHPYRFVDGAEEMRVAYNPGESDSGLFGGNSNWRGPIWFPLNYLIVEALERYHYFYGDGLRVECPTGSGRLLTLREVAREIERRLAALFLPGAGGRRPCHGEDLRYADDPAFRDLVLFYEYFHGDTGRGLGASHQTGWTALVVRFLESRAAARADADRVRNRR